MSGKKNRLSKAKIPKKRRRKRILKPKPPAPAAAPTPAPPPALAPAPALAPDPISSDELATLTGLGDSWLRKIADRGYFPPPINATYQKTESLLGLVKYYRELTELSKASLAIKQESLLDKKIERADFDLSVSRKDFKPTSEIAQMLLAISEEQKSALSFYLLDQLPAINAGLDAVQQRKNNRECLVAVCKRLQDWAKNFKPADPKPSPAATTSDPV